VDENNSAEDAGWRFIPPHELEGMLPPRPRGAIVHRSKRRWLAGCLAATRRFRSHLSGGGATRRATLLPREDGARSRY
jgi:hypothetical protein